MNTRVFGALRSSTGAATNDYRYTGEQTDDNAARGLYYLRARHYDPSLGAFLTKDPLPLMQRYAYVGGNPVTYVDPSGLCLFGAPCPGRDKVTEAAGSVGGAVRTGYDETIEWASDKSIQADLISIAGNFGVPLVGAGIALRNPYLVTAGVGLYGANLGAGSASIVGLDNAKRQRCISSWEATGRQAIVVAGFAPDPIVSTIADVFTLGLDTFGPLLARRGDNVTCACGPILHADNGAGTFVWCRNLA